MTWFTLGLSELKMNLFRFFCLPVSSAVGRGGSIPWRGSREADRARASCNSSSSTASR